MDDKLKTTLETAKQALLAHMTESRKIMSTIQLHQNGMAMAVAGIMAEDQKAIDHIEVILEEAKPKPGCVAWMKDQLHGVPEDTMIFCSVANDTEPTESSYDRENNRLTLT